MWTRRLKKKVQDGTTDPPGVFWISLHDFYRQFKRVYICRLFNDAFSSCTGTFGVDQFEVCFVGDPKKKKDTNMFISITNTSKHCEQTREWPFVSLLLLHADGTRVEPPLLTSRVVASTGNYKNSKHLSIDVSLPFGTPFLLYPSLYGEELDQESTFQIIVYSEGKCQLVNMGG